MDGAEKTGSGYKAKRAERSLANPSLFRELRHLLNRPITKTARGVLDAGVMCRDSALLLSIFATLLGLSAVICEGQAAIFGPTAIQTMGQLFFETHAWLDIKGYGLCDFSPDLSQGGGPGWSQMPAAYLCGSTYRPRGQGDFDYVVDDETQFKLLVAQRMALT